MCNHSVSTIYIDMWSDPDYIPDFEEMKGYIDDVAQTDEGWKIWMMWSHNGYITDEYIEAFKQEIDYCNEGGLEIVYTEYALIITVPQDGIGREKYD